MYRIFIIEDDFSLALAMKKQIEAWGHEVRCVRDFQNVLPAFVEYDPHLVLVDIMLPFSTAITGAARSARFRRFRLSSSRRLPTI